MSLHFASVAGEVRAKFLAVFLLLVAVMAATPAFAQISYSFSGTIAPGQVDAAGLFGPAGGDIGGKPFTVSYSYNPGTFTSESSCGTNCTDYTSTSPIGVMTMSIEINGVTQQGTSYQSADVDFITGNDPPLGTLVGATLDTTSTGPYLSASYYSTLTTASITDPGPSVPGSLVILNVDVGQGIDANIFGTTTPAPSADETLGDCTCGAAGGVVAVGTIVPQAVSSPIVPSAGDPINIATGNVFETKTDYSTVGANPLQFTRYYNSLPAARTNAVSLGHQWRSTYDRYITVETDNSTGTTIAYVERQDGKVLPFTQSSSGWSPESDVNVTLTGGGSTWTLTDQNDTVETYTGITSGKSQVATITARGGYKQVLNYNGSGQLETVTDTYGRKLTFTYSGTLLTSVTTPDKTTISYGYSSSSGSTPDELLSVTYATNPAIVLQYAYSGYNLTNIIDENNIYYAFWSYDSQGRATSNYLSGNVSTTTISYNSDGSRTITNALGQQSIYKFTTLQNIGKLTEIDRLATSTTAAATRLQTYDANGYLASSTDWNGRLTTYVNDPRGLPETIVEASGTAQARTTSITWASNLHVPTRIVTPGLTTSFAYNAQGNLASRTDTATNLKRSWQYTWKNAQITSITGPRTDLVQTTSFGYGSFGRMVSVTNAAGQTTSITAGLPGGLPTTIVDPNGVTTTLAYDARLRLVSSTVKTSAGNETTSFQYDNVGNVTYITLPDGSFTWNIYDAAHRLTNTYDALYNEFAYGLDGLGDRTSTTITTLSGGTPWQESDTFDALGRMIVDVKGAGQKTTISYDNNGNPVRTVAPLSRVITRSFDALNRLTGIAYLGDPAENVILQYDQAGHGFGVGHLTGLSDAAGTLSRTYDERGNELGESRTSGSVTLNIGYTYNAASRLASITYPSGTLVTYARDAAGQVTAISAKIGGKTSSIATSIAYMPLGPVASLKYGNGFAETRAYDLDYRLKTLTTGTVQGLAYAYDAADEVTGITDKVYGNNQAFAYDTLSHLTAATGAYGSFAWTYDGVGNRLTQAQNGTTTHYGYTPATNLLIGIASGGQTTGVTTSGAGNITAILPPSGSATTQTFNQAERLATVTIGGTQVAAYTYDAFGHRVSKTTAGGQSLFNYDQAGHLLEETNGAGALKTDTVYLNGVPIADITPSATFFLHNDRLGTPQVATTTLKAVAWQAAYQPFGSNTGASGLFTQNLRFPGQYADSETGWYQNGFRDYNPGMGRYLESDPIGLKGGQNTFAYAGINPVNSVDASGLCPANCINLNDPVKFEGAGFDLVMGIGAGINFYRFTTASGQSGWVASGGAYGGLGSSLGFTKGTENTLSNFLGAGYSVTAAIPGLPGVGGEVLLSSQGKLAGGAFSLAAGGGAYGGKTQTRLLSASAPVCINP